MSDEQVLVIPATIIEKIGSFTGFMPEVERYLPAVLDRTHQRFLHRSVCETDPHFKQLIPYLILQDATSDSIRLLRYTRGSGQTEKRLHAKQSIGVGGHISIDDCHGTDLYRTGMLRELEEELEVPSIVDERIVGLIYDDSNAVGTVHLGVVHLLKVDAAGVRPREVDLTDASFLPLEQIGREFERLETWSQLAITALFDISAT